MTEHKVIQVEEKDLDGFFERACKKMLLDCFSAREVYTDVVCAILGVTERTIYNYVSDGKMTPLNPGGGKYKFSLADVLAHYMLKRQPLSIPASRKTKTLKPLNSLNSLTEN